MESIRFIDEPSELEARWGEIWPFIQAFEEHHARLLGRVLRDGREAYNKASITRKLGSGRYWLQIAEDGDQLVGIASVQILDRGVTVPERVGYAGLVYITPSHRGGTLNQRMFEARSDILRANGIRIRESTRYRDNGRIAEKWGDESWGCNLRRPIREQFAPPAVEIRRIKDLEADWPAIWSLMQQHGELDEAATRSQLHDILEQRGAIFVAPHSTGVVTGRVALNPWMFVERVGQIRDLILTADAAPGTADALVDRLEQWIANKRATAIQTEPMPHAETAAWLHRGFEPYMYTRHHEIKP